MAAPETNPPSRVVRLVIPSGKMFPRQEYLRTSTPDDPWVLDRLDADVFSYVEADELARKLTTPEIHVFPAVVQGRSEPPMPPRAPREDWHEGKPNCGVD